MSSKQWLAIAIGNTHIRAAVFADASPYSEAVLRYVVRHAELDQLVGNLHQIKFERVAIASVVPQIITPWHHLPQTSLITNRQIPIANIYDSMGRDRALAIFGAGAKYGYPVLVIDAGTALTLTGVDATPALIGGAILPGLVMQFASLNQSTAALPMAAMGDLPNRWATDTVSAIQSGVIYTAIAGLEAFIQDWQQQFPTSQIVFTGGDGKRMQQYLDLGIFDPDLIFRGIQQLWQIHI